LRSTLILISLIQSIFIFLVFKTNITKTLYLTSLNKIIKLKKDKILVNLIDKKNKKILKVNYLYNIKLLKIYNAKDFKFLTCYKNFYIIAIVTLY
jgi:hypothetical protein